MSNQNLDLPVLIYLAKDPCPACTFYNGEWEKTKQQLQGKARFVKFTCKPGMPGGNVPPPLAKYGTWFPSLILAGPKSYFRIFTPDDKVNDDEYSDQYAIKGKKFNAVETSTGYEFAGRTNTADNTVMWFNQIASTIPQYDERTPPRKFANLFQSNVGGQVLGSTNINNNMNAGEMGQNISNQNGDSLKFYV
jgi:hypothetical protein